MQYKVRKCRLCRKFPRLRPDWCRFGHLAKVVAVVREKHYAAATVPQPKPDGRPVGHNGINNSCACGPPVVNDLDAFTLTEGFRRQALSAVNSVNWEYPGRFCVVGPGIGCWGRHGAGRHAAQEYRDGLAVLPGWEGKPRILAAEERWQERPTALVAYRAATFITGEEHELGVWLHVQRYKACRGEPDPQKAEVLDAAVPGWRTGRQRGRRPRE